MSSTVPTTSYFNNLPSPISNPYSLPTNSTSSLSDNSPIPASMSSTSSNSGSMTTPTSSTTSTSPTTTPRPRVTTTLWDDESTLCFQVEAKGVCVARREDNDMINGTKLLNVAGMTRGRRDGILKAEKVRHVVKIGAMHLKGVWIPFERAMTFANKEGIADLLYPLFLPDIKSLLYQNGGTTTNTNPNQSQVNPSGYRAKEEFYSYSNSNQPSPPLDEQGKRRTSTQPQVPPSSQQPQPQQQYAYYQYQDVYNNSQYASLPPPQLQQQQRQQTQPQVQTQSQVQTQTQMQPQPQTQSRYIQTSNTIPPSSTPASQSPVYEYAPPPSNQQPIYQGYPASYAYQVLQQQPASQSSVPTNIPVAASYQNQDNASAAAAAAAAAATAGYQPGVDYYSKQNIQTQQTGPYGLPPQPSYAAYYGGSPAVTPTSASTNNRANFRPITSTTTGSTLPPPSVLSGTTES